uniref:SH3 domain-containing protein n=1 Tax=Macrostomum lignano TaxID=282301 RepID=A0A1I8FFC2_9PLAT
QSKAAQEKKVTSPWPQTRASCTAGRGRACSSNSAALEATAAAGPTARSCSSSSGCRRFRAAAAATKTPEPRRTSLPLTVRCGVVAVSLDDVVRATTAASAGASPRRRCPGGLRRLCLWSRQNGSRASSLKRLQTAAHPATTAAGRGPRPELVLREHEVSQSRGYVPAALLAQRNSVDSKW